MNERTSRVLGALSALGGLLAVVAVLPPRWYGYESPDSYVFDPPTFSPLWVQRTLIPLLAVLAGALLLAGLVGLLVRDRPVAGRPRRWGGAVAVAGLALLEVGQVLLLGYGRARTAPTDELTVALLLLGGFLLGLLGVAFALLGLTLTGVGYARTDRPAVGYALVAGSLLTVVAVAVVTVTGLSGLGSLPTVAPLALAFAAVGHELWVWPDPLPAAADSQGDDATREDI